MRPENAKSTERKSRKNKLPAPAALSATTPAHIDVTQLETLLAQHYPHARCSLNHTNPYQLLVATVLSAQTTDVRVNQVTPQLFAKYPDPPALAGAKPQELREIIRPLGFQQRRGDQLARLAQSLCIDFQGEVPHTRKELMSLAGVGRKTANVVLGDAFHHPAITVDTHVGRLSRRMGLTEHTQPLAVERDLQKLLTPADWTVTCHRLIAHGRAICTARSPKCGECFLSTCPRRGVS